MSAHVIVAPLGGNRFSVTVSEGDSESNHEVVATEAQVIKWGAGGGGLELVEASFRFLLDREPKESIMQSFDLSVIVRYFPEYPERIGDYL